MAKVTGLKRKIPWILTIGPAARKTYLAKHPNSKYAGKGLRTIGLMHGFGANIKPETKKLALAPLKNGRVRGRPKSIKNKGF